MATKSKTKARYGKKITKKKKSTKRRRPALTLGIGIISTIRVPQPLRTAFKQGLKNSNVTIKVEHAVSYNRNKLKRAIEQFNSDTSLGLIVTVGGLVAFQAANLFATKPFISLLGVTPTATGAQCFGGVSLDSSRSNPDRIDHLVTEKGFAPGEIGLFQNPNSAMQAE